MDGKTNKKGVGVIVALAVAILLGVLVLVIAVASLVNSDGGEASTEGSTKYTLTEPQSTEQETTNLLDAYTASASDEQGVTSGGFQSGNVSNNAGGSQTTNTGVTSANPNNGMTDPVKYYESLQKNGDNVLSDYHDNKYIKMVSKKYNVSPELLVAIYSQPDTGNNFVLQFSGKKDRDGMIVKSPDTLEKLYLIDEKGNIAVATGKTTGNEGVSYAEGTLSFYMVKTIVMPQYPDYFVGVEKK